MGFFFEMYIQCVKSVRKTFIKHRLKLTSHSSQPGRRRTFSLVYFCRSWLDILSSQRKLANRKKRKLCSYKGKKKEKKKLVVMQHSKFGTYHSETWDDPSLYAKRIKIMNLISIWGVEKFMVCFLLLLFLCLFGFFKFQIQEKHLRYLNSASCFFH